MFPYVFGHVDHDQIFVELCVSAYASSEEMCPSSRCRINAVEEARHQAASAERQAAQGRRVRIRGTRSPDECPIARGSPPEVAAPSFPTNMSLPILSGFRTPIAGRSDDEALRSDPSA